MLDSLNSTRPPTRTVSSSTLIDCRQISMWVIIRSFKPTMSGTTTPNTGAWAPSNRSNPSRNWQTMYFRTLPYASVPLQGAYRRGGQMAPQGPGRGRCPPHLGGQLFETACRLRGFNNFLRDMLVNQKLAHYLLDQLTAIMIHNSLILARSGIDILLLDDDVASPGQLMISPDMWREYYKPRLADAIRIAREEAPELLVFYHCDGNFTRLLPDLVEIGVNVINPVQPDCMDAAAIKQEFGDRLSLWGTVGTATLWDYGKPRQIQAEVRRRIDTLGPAGLLLAPAYDIDFTPVENLRAFADAVEEGYP